MITLQNVTLLKPGFINREPILIDANVVFGTGERVGVLAAPGTGKSSLARLIAGIDRPDRGTVSHVGRVSWPINFAGYLHPDLTVADNISIFARLVGVSPNSVEEFCREKFGIGHLARKLMKDVSPTQRAILSYACALSVDGPATWIADETITVGEPRDRTMCDAILADRLTTGGLIFFSRNARQLDVYCDRFLVLLNQRLIPCDDLKVAQKALDLSNEYSVDMQKRSRHA